MVIPCLHCPDCQKFAVILFQTTFGKLKNSVKELLTPSWWPGTQSQQECQDDVQAELV